METEYTFRKSGIKEILRTKDDAHTNYKLGFPLPVVQEYPDQTVTHYFRICRKIDSKEDTEGKCYDWYEIDRHYQVVDKTGPVVAKVNENAEFIENAICELDIAINEWFSTLENAMCELSVFATGGE